MCLRKQTQINKQINKDKIVQVRSVTMDSTANKNKDVSTTTKKIATRQAHNKKPVNSIIETTKENE